MRGSALAKKGETSSLFGVTRGNTDWSTVQYGKGGQNGVNAESERYTRTMSFIDGEFLAEMLSLLYTRSRSDSVN